MFFTLFCPVIFLACAVTFTTAHTSCKGQCGAEYYRGYDCQCDYGCLTYGECCDDYERTCTTDHSCKGRCGESFKRGRRCSCDPDCNKFKQCCPDFKAHCDVEEPFLNEATESPVIEGNYEDDDSVPMASPSSYPQDDLSDDMYGQIGPTEEIPINGPEDPMVSPIPETTSGYEPYPTDPLDQVITEPTAHPPTQTTPSDIEPTQASGEVSTESAAVSDPEMTSKPDTATLPPLSTEEQHVTSQPTTNSVPEEDPNPTANPQDLEPEATADDIDPTEALTTTSDPPVVTESTESEQDSSTGSQDSQVATTPETLDSTTTVQDPQDPSTDGSPAAELDSLTTQVPSITDATQGNTKDDATAGETTADPLQVTPEMTKPQTPKPPSKPLVKPGPQKPLLAKPTPAKPISKPDTKPLDPAEIPPVENPRDIQGDDSNDTNLCSGRPVSGVTTLKNGTIAVFRGHYFWVLDRNRTPGPAQSITQVWGIPSPIDTVFTRCNCQGKTYIFKGNRYWRFENDVLDPGYPQLIVTGFDGLRGHITAALSVPQYRRRREAVYFFKRGGLVQKYSYQSGTTPSCARKAHYTVSTVRNRVARQAVSLGPTIHIRKTWAGFPPTITAAVSIPHTREPEGYKYYVFSKSKSYNIRMDTERPVVAAPKPSTSPQSNDVFKCPKKA